MKISKHIYFYEGEKTLPVWGMMCGNTFVIRGNRGELAMTDPGPSVGPHLHNVKTGMARDGMRFNDVKRMIISHAHPDHAQAAPFVAEKLGAEIYYGEKERNVVECPERVWLDEFDFLEGFRDYVMPVPKEVMPGISFMLFGPDRAFRKMKPLREGDMLDLGGAQAHIIETPGHRPGEIAIHIPEDKTLLTGDLINWWRYDMPSLNFPLSDVEQTLTSLKKILALDIETLAPGHEEPVSGKARIKEWVSFAIRKCEVMKKQAERMVRRNPDISLTSLGLKLHGGNVAVSFLELRPIAFNVMKSIDAGRKVLAARGLKFIQ